MVRTQKDVWSTEKQACFRFLDIVQDDKPSKFGQYWPRYFITSLSTYWQQLSLRQTRLLPQCCRNLLKWSNDIFFWILYSDRPFSKGPVMYKGILANSVFESEDEPKLKLTLYWEVTRGGVVGHMKGISLHLTTLEACVWPFTFGNS